MCMHSQSWWLPAALLARAGSCCSRRSERQKMLLPLLPGICCSRCQGSCHAASIFWFKNQTCTQFGGFLTSKMFSIPEYKSFFLSPPLFHSGSSTASFSANTQLRLRPLVVRHCHCQHCYSVVIDTYTAENRLFSKFVRLWSRYRTPARDLCAWQIFLWNERKVRPSYEAHLGFVQSRAPGLPSVRVHNLSIRGHCRFPPGAEMECFWDQSEPWTQNHHTPFPTSSPDARTYLLFWSRFQSWWISLSLDGVRFCGAGWYHHRLPNSSDFRQYLCSIQVFVNSGCSSAPVKITVFQRTPRGQDSA